MKKIQLNTHVYSIPSTWDELTTQQMETLARVVATGPTRPELLVKSLFGFLGMYVHSQQEQGVFRVRKGFRFYAVTPFQVSYLTECLEFLLNGNEVESKRLINPYSEIGLGFLKGRVFYGPGDGLTNITLSEWMQAEIERVAFEETRNEKHLFRFLAILWRPTTPRHPDGDYRAPLRVDTLDSRARYFSRKLKPYQLTVMVWWYLGCLNYINQKFNSVFGKSDELDGGGNTFDGFMKLVNTLAKNDLAKTEKIRESPLYEALYNLQITLDEIDKQKGYDNL